MIESLMYKAIGKIGISGFFTAVGIVGIATGAVLYQVVIKVHELCKDIFKLITENYKNSTFSMRVSSLFCKICAAKHEIHMKSGLFKLDKIKLESDKHNHHFEKNISNSPQQPNAIDISDPPKYQESQEKT